MTRLIALEPLPDNLMPAFLPQGWKKMSRGDATPVIYRGSKGLLVLVSCLLESDREFWLHVSVSHRRRLPTYEELASVKRIFVGADRSAIQVFPRSSEHINIHPHCLHLWSCVSNPGFLPDFTRGIDQI